MDSSFLEAQANRCRSLAENADQFTKRRLLNLAAKYYARLGHPSRVSRTLGIPASLLLEADDVRTTTSGHLGSEALEQPSAGALG
jgi:hypothetical protein